MNSLLFLFTNLFNYFALNSLAVGFAYYTGLSFSASIIAISIGSIASFITLTIVAYNYRENISNFLKNFSIFSISDKVKNNIDKIKIDKIKPVPSKLSSNNLNNIENLIDRLIIIKQISNQPKIFEIDSIGKKLPIMLNFYEWIKVDVNKEYLDIILKFNKGFEEIDDTKVKEYKEAFKELNINPEKMKDFLISNPEITKFMEANIYKLEEIINIYKAEYENFSKENPIQSPKIFLEQLKKNPEQTKLHVEL